jgi:hypothetical protein
MTGLADRERSGRPDVIPPVMKTSGITAALPAQDLGRAKAFYVEKVGFEPTHPRIFPDSALEYAGWGEIPELGISCGHRMQSGSRSRGT